MIDENMPVKFHRKKLSTMCGAICHENAHALTLDRIETTPRNSFPSITHKNWKCSCGFTYCIV